MHRFQPFLRLLFSAAHLTVILVFITEGLHAAEASQTVGYTGVLLHIHRQVKEVLVLATHLYKVKENNKAQNDKILLKV